MVDEAGQCAWRVEEVERISGRWRVDDDEIEALVEMQREQALGRHVLLGAAERAGDVAIERVVQDTCRLLTSDRGFTVVTNSSECRCRVETQRP